MATDTNCSKHSEDAISKALIIIDDMNKMIKVLIEQNEKLSSIAMAQLQMIRDLERLVSDLKTQSP